MVHHVEHAIERRSFSGHGRVADDRGEQVRIVPRALDLDVKVSACCASDRDKQLNQDRDRIAFGVRLNGSDDLADKAVIRRLAKDRPIRGRRFLGLRFGFEFRFRCGLGFGLISGAGFGIGFGLRIGLRLLRRFDIR